MIVTLVLTLISLVPIQFVSSQAESCLSLPKMETSVQVPVNGAYAVWLNARSTAEGAEKAYVYFEGDTTCEEIAFEALNDDTFEWISGTGGVIKHDLVAGTRKMYVALKNGTLHMQRAVVTGNVGCIPVDDGTNCLEQDVSIQVSGIQSTQRYKDSMNVSVTFSGAPLQNAKVSYFFDNAPEPYAVRTSSPYCLSVASGSCNALSVPFLKEGDHRLRIVMSADNMSETTQSIPFTITPVIAEGEIVDVPGRSITQLPLPRTVTPVTANAPEKKNTVVVGTSTQTVKKTLTGSSVATVTPSQPITNGDKITYKVNDKPVATKVIGQDEQYDASAVVDVSNEPDGDATITAEVQRPSGIVESYTARANIDNSTNAKTKNWLGNGGFLAITALLGTIALIAGGFYVYKMLKEKNAFAQMHNITDYDYVRPEQNQLAYALPPVAVMFFAVGAIFTSLTSAASARVGAIADFTKNSVLASGYQLESKGDVAYIAMKHEASMNEGEHNHEPEPTTPEPTPPAPEPTPPQPNPQPTTPPVAPEPAPTNPNPPAPVPPPQPNPEPAPVTPTPVVTAGTLPVIASNFDVNQYLVPDPYNGKSFDGAGNFRFFCHFSHMAYDDPVVYPGRVGASHLHTFFGNTAINANTTYETLRTTGGGTCDGGPLNRSGYWVPAVYNAQGKVVLPHWINIYYKSEKFPISFIKSVQPVPRGLRIIAGYDMINMNDGRGRYGEGNFWGCESGGLVSGRSMPACASGQEIRATIQFPSCWDGKNLDTPDHRSHMAYPVGNMPGPGDTGCPSSHPVHIPEITVHLKYRSDGNSSSWRLSSDMNGQPNGESMHADWWGGWDEDIMMRWYTSCLLGQSSATMGHLCDGKQRLIPNGSLPTANRSSYVVDAPPRP